MTDIDHLNSDSGTATAPPSNIPVADPGLKPSNKFFNNSCGLYQKQAHHTDHMTNTEVGVMNNFEGAQNVITGCNQGRLIWTISCLKHSPAFQQVLSISKSLIKVCNKHKMLLTSISILFNSCGFGDSNYSSDN